jgi:PST family polysaccharide transporter
MSWLVIPMSVGIFIFSDCVTEILLGAQWKEASGFIGLWGLMTGATMLITNLASEVYRSKGNPRLAMFMQVIHVCFVISVVLLTVHREFETFYIARSFIRLQGVIASVIVLCAIYKFSIRTMMLNLIPAIVSSMIMGAVGYFLSNINSAVWWQLVSVGICIVVYFTSLLGLFPKARKEILNISFVAKFISKIKKV